MIGGILYSAVQLFNANRNRNRHLNGRHLNGWQWLVDVHEKGLLQARRRGRQGG